MHSDSSVHITWDSLAVHLQQRAQLDAQVLAGFQPKPWRVPVEVPVVQPDDTIDWCATP